MVTHHHNVNSQVVQPWGGNLRPERERAADQLMSVNVQEPSTSLLKLHPDVIRNYQPQSKGYMHG